MINEVYVTSFWDSMICMIWQLSMWLESVYFCCMKFPFHIEME
jgi:hypothetical protein